MSADKPSPNPSIDRAIEAMMLKLKGKKNKVGEIESLPPDIAIKVINTAINWEKAKHQIIDKENPFDPDTL